MKTSWAWMPADEEPLGEEEGGMRWVVWSVGFPEDEEVVEIDMQLLVEALADSETASRRTNGSDTRSERLRAEELVAIFSRALWGARRSVLGVRWMCSLSVTQLGLTQALLKLY